MAIVAVFLKLASMVFEEKIKKENEL